MNIEYYKRNPTAFLEECCGIKLLPQQKVFIDKMYNSPKKYYYVPARGCNFGHIRLLLSIMNLEDGSTIVIASPNESKEITKEQLIEAWVNVYKRRKQNE